MKKTTYKVTCTVFVQANSPRHAAHIGKGVMAMEGAEGPNTFHVEEQRPTETYTVDLSKSQGQDGYADQL